MSDEESFVILGSTPTPSMEAYSSLDSQPPRRSPIQQNIVEKKLVDEMVQSSLQTNFSLCSTEPNMQLAVEKEKLSSEQLTPIIQCVGDSLPSARETHFSAPIRSINLNKDLAKDSVTDDQPNSKMELPSSCISSGIMIRSITSGESSLPESVAEKYILGKIDENTVKQTIYSQFPSFSSCEDNQKDIHKLQQLINDNNIFKSQLFNMNSTMKQLIDMIKVNKNTQMIHQNEIAKLRNDNLELRKELEARMELIRINEEMIKTDNFSMRQAISEKSSLINNLTAQIERLELQQQDLSFEMIKGSINHADSQYKSEIVLTAEHSRMIKAIEQKLSEVTAENLELQDMKKIYNDEINCLKVNLTAAEELIKQSQFDISFLKSKDVEKSEILAKYNEEKAVLKQEIDLLKAQLEIYQGDFQMERNARQEIAGEKEQLLTDLKLLQRRNQQLIEENQQRLQNTTPSHSSSPAGTKIQQELYKSNLFVCPLCNRTFPALGILEAHVQACLSD